MLLPNTTTLSIKTDIRFFTAIYERIYTLTVNASNEKSAVITVKAVNKVPSGYDEGGSRITLLECEEVVIPTSGSVKAWLAKLAYQHDAILNQATGCPEAAKSRKLIKDRLRSYF